MSNPYDVPDISMLMRAQMATYRSITDSTKIFWHVSKTMKEAFKGAQQVQKYSETLRKSMIAVPSAKELGYLSNAMNLSSDTGIAEQLKVTYNIASSTASLGSSLREAMKPFFDSHDLKMTSTANDILNKVSTNPSDSYASFQKALSQQTTPRLKQLDQEVRNQIEQIKHENNEGYDRSSFNDRTIDTEAAIKELQNPSNVDKTGNQDSEFSVKYFILIFQIITLILFTYGCISDSQAFTELSYFLELIDKSITLYYNQPK